MYYNYDADADIARGISPTIKSIKDYICLYTNCSTVDVVDEFDTLKTRHICPNSNVIVLLDKMTVPVPTVKGIVNAEIFFCPVCRKTIINKSSILLV